MSSSAKWCLLWSALMLTLVACGGDDPTLELVQANPMASPTLSFGEITGQGARTGSTSTGIGPSRLDTRATTTFEVPPDRVDEAFDELVAQAEAHGYEFQEAETGSSSRKVRGGAEEYEWATVVVWHTEKTVIVEVIGIRPERRAGS